jgi:SagB-type dehydrogenase family enzyme
LKRLIGLDSRREVCLACINVHGKSFSTSSAHINIEPLTPEFIVAGRVSKHEILYDEIQDIYRAGIGIPEKVETDPRINKDLGVGAGRWIQIDRKNIIKREMGFVESVIKRRSRRNFINRSLSQNVFMRLLDLICFSWDQNSSEEHFSSSSITIGFLTDNIEKFQSGFYLMDPLEWKIGLVTGEKLIDKMASVCLDQKWLRNACVHFLFVTNLAVIDKNWGSRGYRYAMLNAGRMGQTIYIGATALGLGCCGIGALYDGEAKNLLGLNNESVLLYLVAIGSVTK